MLLLFFIIVGYLAYHTFAYTYKTATYELNPTMESYIFFWNSPDDFYLAELREKYGLDEIIKDSENDYDKLREINNWVNELWEHHGSNQPDKSDPLHILEQVEKGDRFRCVEYSIVVSGSLNAIGIPSRVLALKTHNVEVNLLGAGHVVAEAYLQDLGKWVMVDGQWDVIPALDGEPLSALELQQALAREDEKLGVVSSMDVDPEEYFRWIRPYLYYMDVALDQRAGNNIPDRYNEKLMLVPEGARKPVRFQLRYPLENMIYTYSAAAFYNSPEK